MVPARAAFVQGSSERCRSTYAFASDALAVPRPAALTRRRPDARAAAARPPMSIRPATLALGLGFRLRLPTRRP